MADDKYEALAKEIVNRYWVRSEDPIKALIAANRESADPDITKVVEACQDAVFLVRYWYGRATQRTQADDALYGQLAQARERIAELEQELALAKGIVWPKVTA